MFTNAAFAMAGTLDTVENDVRKTSYCPGHGAFEVPERTPLHYNGVQRGTGPPLTPVGREVHGPESRG